MMFNISVYGANTRTCSPGDLVLVQGVIQNFNQVVVPKFFD